MRELNCLVFKIIYAYLIVYTQNLMLPFSKTLLILLIDLGFKHFFPKNC